MKLKIVLAAVVVLATAGASSAEPAKGPAKPSGRQCFYSRDVTSFAAPDEQTLYVRVGVRDVYRFDMFARCPDIDWNQSLALISRGSSWICSGMDAEVVSHSPIGRQRCPVRDMHKLTPDEVAALPKRARP